MTTWAVDIVNGSDTQVAPSQVAGVVPTVYSKAAACQITSNGHGLLTGDYIYITGVTGTGWTVVNGYWTITFVDANNFTIPVSTAGATGATPTVFGTWITAIQKTNPCAVTLRAHGFSAGQLIYITGIVGMTQLNSIVYKVGTVTNANNFTLTDTNGNNINATGYTVYTSGGTYTTYSKIITNITNANPAVVTCTAHGYSNGDKVYHDVQGMTQVHKLIGTVANKTTDTYELSGINSTAYGTFTGGTSRKPYLLANTVNSIPSLILSSGDTVYLSQTWKDDSSVDVGSGNIVFTQGSLSITTSVSLIGTVAVGDFIGKTTAVGTGWDGVSTRPELFHRVTAISATTITLATKYAGDTATVSSVSRLRVGTEIRTTGAVSATAIAWTANGVTIEGGYDLSGGIITRNGETWIKPVTDGQSVLTLGGQDCTARYFGLIHAFVGTSGVSVSGTNSILEYCYMSTYGSGRNCIYTSGTNTTIRYCATTNAQAGFPNIQTDSATGLINYCYAISHPTSTGYSFQTAVAYSVFSNCKTEYSQVGYIGANGIGGIVRNCTFNQISGQASRLYANQLVEGCTFSSCATAIITHTANNKGLIIRNNTFNANTLAIDASGMGSAILENNTYTSNTRDFATTESSGNIIISGHNTTTPGTWAFDLTSNYNKLTISNFVIDAPSIAKAFSALASGAGYATPIYTMMGSSQYADGSYYYHGSYLKDSSVYRTSSPSMKLALNGTYTLLFTDIPVFKVFAKSGVAKTVTFYMQRHASWSGTIIPKFKLNGITINTQSTITSIGTSWEQFVMTATSGQITQDGELSLEFNYNANANPIYLDDFTVT